MEKTCFIWDILDKNSRTECFSTYYKSDIGVLRIEYGSSYENTKILREIIDEFCTIFWIPAKWKTRLVLIYDELNNNAIEHWSAESDLNYCYISLEKRNEGIYVIGYVEDTGKAEKSKNYNDLKAMQEEFKNKDFSKHHSIRWRWLFLIISQLVNFLDFRPASLWWVQVYFEKLIPLE